MGEDNNYEFGDRLNLPEGPLKGVEDQRKGLAADIDRTRKSAIEIDKTYRAIPYRKGLKTEDLI